MVSSQVRAIVGARVSHVQGKEKTSHLEQHETGGKYALGQEWPIVGTFEDLDVSAIKTSPWERPDLKPWLTERAHEWDALIVTKTDRLFRSAKDSVDLAHWAEQNKKILVFVDDGLKLDFYHPENEQDPWGSMMTKIFLLLSSVFAELEGRRFVQRAQSRTRFLRTTDRWSHGSPRFGFRIVDHPSGKGKALDHEPGEQLILHDIGERRFLEDGKRFNTIAADLLADGIPSSRDMRRIQRGEDPLGDQWTPDKIADMLTSPSTQGIKLSHGKPVLNPDGSLIRVGPPSFEPDVWARIQSRVAELAGSPKEHSYGSNPLLGIGKCGKCESSLRHHVTRKQSGRQHRYFRCGKAPRACQGVSIPSDDALELVRDEFLRKCGDMPVLRRRYEPGEDSSYERDEVDATIGGLREDRALGLFSSAADQALYRDQMSALMARRDELAGRPIVAAGWVYEQTDRAYREEWAETDILGRRQLLVDAGVVFTLFSRHPLRQDIFVPDDIRERMNKR